MRPTPYTTVDGPEIRRSPSIYETLWKKCEILPSSTGATAGFLPTINRYDSTKMPIHLTMHCFVLGPDHPATSPHRSPQRCLTSWVSDSRRLIFSLRCKPTVKQQSPRKAVRVLGSSAHALEGHLRTHHCQGSSVHALPFFGALCCLRQGNLGGLGTTLWDLGRCFRFFLGWDKGTRGLGTV